MSIHSINPATGKPIKPYALHTAAQSEWRLARAHRAQKDWAGQGLAKRVKTTLAFADILKDTADICAPLMVREMGKTLKAAYAELEKCVEFCQYSARHAEAVLADSPVATEYAQSFTRPYPLGTILLVMPWNFPFWQAIRVAIPALLAGNTIVLKHAPNVPGCALKLQSLFEKAGYAKGCFQTLLISEQKVESIIADPRIHAASVTGSEGAGQAVAGYCAKAIKPCVLELGGSDPFIVMRSADMETAIGAAITSRMRNNGQSCIAAKRLIIHRDIYDEFRSKFIKRMNALIVGDPMDNATDIGPLCRREDLAFVENQLEQAVKHGALMTQSPTHIPKAGSYIAPAILENISAGNPIYAQEIFAPIASLYKARDIEHAITLANDTEFGLSSVLFSQDGAEIELAIHSLRAGSTFVNRYASSDIRMPFGGIKKSGFGREMGKEGMLAFTNIKTVIVNT